MNSFCSPGIVRPVPVLSLVLALTMLASGLNRASGQRVPDTTRFTSFDGIRIHYEVAGLGRPVILVHGFIVNSQSWKKTALYRDLLQAGYQVILVDLRGNGQSDKPHDSSAYAHDAEARDIMTLASRLHLKRYAAVGYSRGSIIVSRLLVLDRRVKRAVLGGMGADFTNPQWPRRLQFYRALRGDSVPELASMVRYVDEQHLDRQALACQQQEQPSTSREELARIRVPVLLVCGDQDTDNGSARELAALIPGSLFRQTPGVHNTANGTPEFSREVITFLAKK
ncbi:MAG TPA: alpha/beta hydrolase [Chitinophagaceae bacterium]|nr:alpha/beta hydrolase [Chitinophagaceae bacterium]